MVNEMVQRFYWLDYIACTLMIALSIAIGLFYGFYRGSQNTQDYLRGGGQMPLIPVSMSLIASFVSVLLVVGTPAEIYFFGIQYFYIVIGLILFGFIFIYVYLPVFYNLGITSIYEYLERRFDKKVRILVSVLFTINLVTWLPLVVFVTAIVINQVTGIGIQLITSITCTICIVYTCIGGIKAVIWTDVLQSIYMYVALLVVLIKGTYDVGGFQTVWQRNLETERIEAPLFDISLIQRHTFWSLSFGSCLYYINNSGLDQLMFQRYISLPSLASAKKAAAIYIIGMIFTIFIGSLIGLLMFATYYNCDPWSSGAVNTNEQMLIVLALKVVGDYPGLLGIFVAGVLSSTLSSLSTGLNSMATVVLEDFTHVFYNKPLTKKQASIIMRSTIVIFGIIYILAVIILENFKNILQLSMSLNTIGSSPVFGLFTIGVLLPWVKVKGALAGGLSSLIFMTYLCFRSQVAIASGELIFKQKPLSTEGCTFNFTSRNATSYIEPKSALHHISYLWYTLFGLTVCILAALIVSALTESFNSSDVDPELLSPIIRRYFNNNNHNKSRMLEAVELKKIKYTSNHNKSKGKNTNAYTEMNICRGINV